MNVSPVSLELQDGRKICQCNGPRSVEARPSVKERVLRLKPIGSNWTWILFWAYFGECLAIQDQHTGPLVYLSHPFLRRFSAKLWNSSNRPKMMNTSQGNYFAKRLQQYHAICRFLG